VIVGADWLTGTGGELTAAVGSERLRSGSADVGRGFLDLDG